MRTLSLNIPEELQLSDREIRLLIAASLYEKGQLSLGQSAAVAGFSKKTFMELLGDYNTDIINHPVSDLDNDIKNAKHYSR